MNVQFTFSKEGEECVTLTDYSIQSIRFKRKKTHNLQKQTRDIELQLKVENADVQSSKQRTQKSNDSDDNNQQQPNEIDDVINLLLFISASYNKQLAYLDGNVKIYDMEKEIADFDYENLFALSSSEDFTEDTKFTYFTVLIRERAR